MADISLFPGDVLINILKRLPVKRVLVSRTVCKNWNFVLRSSNFISLYYNHQLCIQERNAKHGVSSFLLLQFVQNSNHTSHILLSFLTVKKMSNQLISTVEKDQIIDIPFSRPMLSSCRNDYGRIGLIGVYDGIICLANENCVILYTPSIRESQKIPFPNFAYQGAPYYGSYVFGIWFESNKPGTVKHYKIFRVVTPRNTLIECAFEETESFTTVLEVYDSSESNWRESKVTGVPPDGRDERGLLFKGTFHLYIGGDSVYTLDPYSEISGHFSLPSEFVPRIKCPLFVLGESLAWFSTENDKTDIWIMTEYGVKESWTKQYTFEGGFVLVSPLTCWNCMNENELFLDLYPNQLISINLVTKKVTVFPLCKTHRLMTVVPYMETLSLFGIE